MRAPRDLSCQEFLKALKKKFGYQPTHQVGSHIRITTYEKGQHHLSVPNHNPIKFGTINGILNSIADHFQISKTEVYQILFE